MASDPIEITIPRETVNDESVKLLRWHVEDGAHVSEGQAIADVETSKAVLELEATSEGFVKLLAKAGQEVGIGAAICLIVESLLDSVGVPEKEMAATAASAPALKEPVAVGSPKGKRNAIELPREKPGLDASVQAVRFTPLAERLAKESGLTLGDFSGLRIVRSEDVRARIEGRPIGLIRQAPIPVQSNGAAADSSPHVSGADVRWEELPRRKQVEIRQISGGSRLALMSSVTLAVPTSGLKAAVANADISDLTASAIIVYETARLLKKYPLFNAIYWDNKAGLYETVNIGWAIDDGSGLMVPVIHNASDKSLREIASSAQDIIERFVDNALTVKDFVGGTFTISDLSSEGVFTFSPMIGQGQSAILGVGAEFFVGTSPIGFMNLTLAFDHQLGDGRMAAKFLQDLSERLIGYESTFTTVDEVSQAAPALLVCSGCFRDSKTLEEIKAYLLKSESPDGYICSICLRGL